MPADDVSLMRAYQKGDYSAFVELYARVSPKVWAFLLARLRNQEEAAEVFQAIFLKFHQARDRYDPNYPVLQWLYVISRSVWLDHLRRQRREVPIVEADLSQYAGTPTLNSLDAVESDSKIDLSQLTDEQRQVMEWRVVDELSYEQIAVRLDRTPASVRQILSRTLRRLRLQSGGQS